MVWNLPATASRANSNEHNYVIARYSTPLTELPACTHHSAVVVNLVPTGHMTRNRTMRWTHG